MSSDLQKFHHSEEPEAKSTKMVGWIVIALIVIGAGAWVAQSGVLNPQPANATHAPRGL
jgi:hypothetical protein